MDNVLTAFPAGPGQEIVMDGRKWISAYWDGSAPAALVAGLPVVVSYNYTYRRKIIVPATMITHNQDIGGVHEPRTAAMGAGYLWVQIEGEDDDVQVYGDPDVAAGNYLQVINGGTYLIYANTTLETESVAMSCVAYTTHSAAAKSVIWLGHRVLIAATA